MFIQGYGRDNFNWGQEAQVAFEQLKKAQVTTYVLIHI